MNKLFNNWRAFLKEENLKSEETPPKAEKEEKIGILYPLTEPAPPSILVGGRAFRLQLCLLDLLNN